MEELEKQVRRARWWLSVGRFVAAVGWCCFATLLAALAIIVVDRFWPTGLEAWVWASGAIVAGLVGAMAWSIFTGSGPVDAAIEIDRRFGLKARVSSTLAMSPKDRETQAGQALVEDAACRVARIDVRERFKVSPGRQILFPLVPGVVALLVALLVSPAALDNPAAANTEAVAGQVKKSSQSLRKKLAEQRKRASQEGLQEARELFEQLERGAEELAIQPQADRKQALVKLNDLAREVQRRRQSLGGAENIQKQLNQLKNLARGPADQFLKEIARGNFNKALEQLKRLKEELAKGNLSHEEQQQLAEQLQQMKEKLEQLIEAHRRAEEDVEKRIEQARQAGRKDEAEQLQQELNKLRQQLPQMNQLQNLAEALGQCSQCIRDAQLLDADALLGDLEADLSALRDQIEELQMLDQAMDQLAQCRNRMNCPMCGGAGCRQCMEGVGMGEGQGIGPRPEQETPINFRDTRTPQKIGPGSASVVGEVEGPNIKGDVRQQLQEQLETARREPADPLTGQQMPRKHRRHAKEYFDRFRTGE